MAGSWAAALVVVAVSFTAAADTTRSLVDARDVQRLTTKHPTAVPLLEEGEDLASKGDLEGALAAFHEAGVAAPENALVARQECQTLTRLGKRAEALQACLRSLRAGGSPTDLRATVGAFMSGPVAPTSGELAQAMRLARRAREMAPDEPWGHAAECEIAARVRDAQMLEGCLGELRRVAPDHEETARAMAAAAPLLARWWVWCGWALIALLGSATLLHAAWHAARAWSTRPRAGARAALLLAVGLGFSPARSAHAQDAGSDYYDPLAAHPGLLSDWPVDDKNPEKSIPDEKRRERNPLQFGYWLMDLTYKASQATKRGDHQAAIHFYRALAEAVPDRSVSFTRLCEAYEAAGEWKNAVDTCANAITLPGVTANDYSHLFTVALAKKENLTSQEVNSLSSILEHLRGDPVGRDMADDLECQLAVRLEDVSRLQRCTTALVAKAPDDARTISYQWALAVALDDFDLARTLVERARATEMKPEGIEQMERGLATLEDTRRRKSWAWRSGALAVALAGAAAAVFATRRRGAQRTA